MLLAMVAHTLYVPLGILGVAANKTIKDRHSAGIRSNQRSFFIRRKRNKNQQNPNYIHLIHIVVVIVVVAARLSYICKFNQPICSGSISTSIKTTTHQPTNQSKY